MRTLQSTIAVSASAAGGSLEDPLIPALPAASSSTAADPLAEAKDYVRLVVGLGSLIMLDKFLKQALTSNGILFPAPLVGMFGIVAVLMLVGEQSATAVSTFYNPALNWVAKWLPLFYIASLVTLPLGLKGIAGRILAGPCTWEACRIWRQCLLHGHH